jgi:hypothetical protein
MTAADLITDFEPTADDWQEFALWRAGQDVFDDAGGVDPEEVAMLAAMAGEADPFA